MEQRQSRRNLVFTLIFIMLIGNAGMVVAVRSQTWYVDDDNTSGPWDGSLLHPFQRITDAVNNAADGDTIYVFNGSYTEEITITKTLQLIGQNKTTTILNVPLQDPSIGILCNATNIIINGFTIRGQPHAYFITAIFIQDSTPYHSHHNTITNNIFCNTSYGIHLIDSSNNTITHNTFNNNDYGVLQELKGSNTYHHNTFTNTFFESSEENTTTTIDHNTFQHTTIDLTGGPYNIHTNTFTQQSTITIAYSTTALTFQDNHFFQSLGLELIPPLAWNNLTIQNNTINDYPITYWYNHTHSTVPNSSEIILANCTDITINHLTLNNTYGILLVSTTNTHITNTTLTDTHGIQLYQSTNNLITHNTIKGNEPALILTQSTHNNITANFLNGSGIQSYTSSQNTYTGNHIQNANTGIMIHNGDHNNIESNQIQANLTLSLSQTHLNSFINNNFLHPTLGYVRYYANSCDTSTNTWRHNYWNGHIPFLPKLIIVLYPSGYYRDPDDNIPIYFLCFNIDLRPAWHPNPVQ